MILINDFFVRHKEAVSNQMELISKRNNGKIIAATRFMNQKAMQSEDIKDNIYIYSPMVYIIKAMKEIISNPKEIVHIFEEEPCLWKRLLLNFSKNPLYVSMYRRPNEKYSKHLKKYKNLKKVFVELDKHKEMLIQYGFKSNQIEVTPTPSKIPRKKSEKIFNKENVNIVFASWNNAEGDAIVERGLEYLLGLLRENTNFYLTIPLRDNDTKEFEKRAEEYNVWDRIALLNINNNTDLLINMFDEADFVAFVPQKKVVKDVPNSLIDGIVRGKPIIISNVIDFSDTVAKEKIGYVIEKGYEPKKLEITAEEYKKMSDKAYSYSIKHSQDNYAKIIEKAYKNKK